MAGSGISDLLNLMYYMDSQDEKKRAHIKDQEAMREKHGSVGNKEVPESEAAQVGMKPEERSTKDTAHFKQNQLEGQHALLDAGMDMQKFKGMSAIMGQHADTPEKQAAWNQMQQFISSMQIKHLQTLSKMYNIKPAGPGEPPGPLDEILSNVSGVGAATK